MAIIRNAANTLMKGRVGQTTYYISKGQQVARQSRNDSNYGDTARRTVSQQNRRVLWANLVNFYKMSAKWMPKAFESKKPGQTDYNKFMAVNVPTSRIALAKNEAEAGACVIDNFLVSQGSLPSIEVSETVMGLKTNLLLGSYSIDANSNVAQVSQALIEANANVTEGMQLSFVMYQQVIDAVGIPRANCRCYEMTLDLHDNSLAWNHIPEIGLKTISGAVGSNIQSLQGGVAWILSENGVGSLRVSTQLLTVKNASLIAQYSSDTQLSRAAQSYGIDTEVLLNPNTTVSQSQEPESLYIEQVKIDNDSFRGGDFFGYARKLYNKTLEIYLNDSPALEATSVTLLGVRNDESTTVTGTNITTEGNVVEAEFAVSEGSTVTVTGFRVVFANGDICNIEFTTESGDMG